MWRSIRFRLTGRVFKKNKQNWGLWGKLHWRWILFERLWSPFHPALFVLCPGFEGSICERNVDDCPNHNCQNGGICVDGVNTYNCRCPPQWTGTYCGKHFSVGWTRFTGMKCRISGLLSPYNSSCKWLDVVHICTLFCSLGDRCQWILQKIVYIKATTKRGNFPLHCSALQPYMHVIFTDKSCGSWAAMQCDSELHCCLYGLACKRVYISQKYKAWLFYYNCVLLWCFDTFGGIFDVG